MKTSTYVLGITAFYHDSSACIIHNDEVIAAASEERFSREKHDNNFPEQAILFCLKKANISLLEVDYISFFEKPFVTFERLIETYLNNAPFGFKSFRTSSPIWLKNKIFMKMNIINSLAELGKVEKDQVPKIIFSPHHRSHASSAFYPSPFNQAAIICVDGVGEYATTSIWRGNKNKIELIKQINFPHSIGLLYSAFTYYCGFKVNDGEYKLMGLAPYGEPKYVDLITKNLITIHDDGSYRINRKYFDYETGLKMTNSHFNKLFGGPARIIDSEISQKIMDIAASIQEVTNTLMVNIAKHAKEITGEENLCLAGGVALNCVANGKILQEEIFKNLWIQPASGDDGGSVGSALGTYFDFLDNERIAKRDSMKSCYLGPEYSNEFIKEYLDSINAQYTYCEDTNSLTEMTVDSILNEKVIGWFQGRTEFGPRALGNRSILGKAQSTNLQKEINLKIKFRESFRPFAPSLLLEDVSKVFSNIKESPFMLIIDELLKEHQFVSSKNNTGLGKLNHTGATFPAITHVNNSGRVQTVTESSNHLYYKLLSKVKKETGTGILINTSFNVRGEPIVNSPTEAYSCFMKTDMDVLVIGNFYLNKKDQPLFNNKTIATKEETNESILVFWIKFYVFILILFYVTLPLAGLQRNYFPAILGGIPFILSIFLKPMMMPFTRRFKSKLTYLEQFINSILLGIVFFLMITPYSFLARLFINNKNSSKESNWSEGENLKINDKLF
jgi:carbamoyltransferase